MLYSKYFFVFLIVVSLFCTISRFSDKPIYVKVKCVKVEHRFPNQNILNNIILFMIVFEYGIFPGLSSKVAPHRRALRGLLQAKNCAHCCGVSKVVPLL